MTIQNAGDVALADLNRWAWYQKALANPAEIGKSLIVHESDPQQGYYRTRQKGGQWEPVAIFYPEGADQLVAYRNGKEVRDISALWVWCCRYPISYEAYEKAMAGSGFDDEPPAPATVGHNSGDADPFEAIKIELAGEKEMAESFLKSEVKTQADADKAGIWSKRLSDLAKRADNHRVVEKEPHLAASRAVDDKWRDPIAEAKELATKLKRHVEPYLIAQKRKADEAARKAREEAERQRREAMQAQDEEQRAAALKAAQEAEKAAARAAPPSRRTPAPVELVRACPSVSRRSAWSLTTPRQRPRSSA